jgi:hypothetical protein
MNLDHIKDLTARQNSTITPPFVLDSPEKCLLGVKHWNQHEWQNFDYRYNSDGFRTEYNLPRANIIAVGDSFTEHWGGPVNEQYSKHIKEDVINLGVDGAGNDTIADIVKWSVNKFQPKTIIVMYSYFHRYNGDKEFMADCTDDYKNCLRFLKAVSDVRTACSNIKLIESCIPDDLYLEEEVDIIDHIIPNRIKYEQVDTGRDGAHFGPKTVRTLGSEINKYI